eukprot:1239248-Ditylum_brightwellii.AAC.1
MVTSYGVSETSITYITSQPIYGLGHGATDALPNWTLHGNICQKASGKHSKGCRILDPTGSSDIQ